MTAWQDSLRQVQGRIGPGTGRFLRWWRHGLLAWVPVRWQWALGWGQARLLLLRDGDHLQVWREAGERREDVVRLPWPLSPQALDRVLEPRLRGLPRVWLLPATDVLRRTLRLPGAAADRLRAVVGFEIDRQTPFESSQVSFDVRELGLAGEGQLQVELVAWPLRQLDAWRASVGEWADALAGVDAIDAQGRALQVNLLPPAQRQRRPDPMRRWNVLLTVAALLMLVLAALQLLDNRRAAADELRAQVERSARSARGVASERAQLQALVEGAAFLEKQRNQRAGTVEIWNELTRRLPEGTYLEKLAIESNNLQLIGLSREASQLVQLLQDAPQWRKVNLTGVLQADGAASGRDRFTMTAELQPLAAARTEEAADADAKRTP
ncbi:PilN domain-containing protein [Stenotrophomonas maltophilia]|jgi:general secretion pathway protein L|uniref:PilN domain-containing protein n=1 Tax=Stenotrophomonas TaxID=40323 RepID=UPI00201CCEA9|nr:MULTISPECIES: PilN domain-containing protein [Stenotrophomonas]MBN5026367.1 PilN domain-containing protein [Stenotrophomonas maltophilia]MDH1273040.1 PilN domain-containing protein [Stenotrophomonas sp. GD03937]MDH1484372.1 PilN domain-containing protein [Stenotrophomonas sp. GD03712]UQY94019.1 PilN domain-containing protein [Stenotrophomonas maltophilia]WON69303.1 PilN domain-containing protein [Stenotrophomonas maltophilia]